MKTSRAAARQAILHPVFAFCLVARVKEEIARSRDAVPREFPAEYERALAADEALAAAVEAIPTFHSLRGLTLKNAWRDAIRLEDDQHDGVIVECDISGWGRIDADAGANGKGSEVWTVYGDAGEVLPNFNDGFTGAAPDLGAHEAGAPPMEFGVNAYRKR